MTDDQQPADDTRSLADQIAAKANPSAPPAEPEPALAPEPSPWAPEAWRGRWIVSRNVQLPNSPQLIRQVHGTSRLGSTALVFESEEAAQRCADKLNEGEEA